MVLHGGIAAKTMDEAFMDSICGFLKPPGSQRFWKVNNMCIFHPAEIPWPETE